MIFLYFSGNDYTHIFGSNMWDGNFTPRASNCWKDGVKSLIVDGEMVPWDPETETRGKMRGDLHWISLITSSSIRTSTESWL